MKKIIMSYEQCKEIAYKINNKEKSLTKISKEINISSNTISKKIKEYGIKLYYSNVKLNFSKEKIQEMLNDYINGLPLKKVALKNNISEYGLANVFKRSNIDITKLERYGKHKDVNLNKDIFEKIDTEEKAYWLGFILADGYIDKNYQSLEIGLKESDKQHLEKLKTFLNSNAKIRYKEKTKSYSLAITSKKICQDLKKHGIENAKSLTCRLNEELMNCKLQNHYIRGFWDGDGTVYIKKNKQFQIGFSKTELIINDIKNNISYFNNIKPVNKKRTNGYQISLGHKKSIEFIKYMYKDANIYLERKYNKIIAVCDEKYPSISQIIRTE